MNIRGFIQAKKQRFQSYQESRQKRKEVDRYKEIVDRERRVIKLEAKAQDERRIAELKAREQELNPSMLSRISANNRLSTVTAKPDKRIAGVAQSARSGIGRPTLFGNPNSNIGSDYRGQDFSSPASTIGREDIGDVKRPKKKGGYDPFGYKGIF